MSSGATVTVVERCAISPPPRSTPPATLPLTFFDIPWLFFSPSQPIFFFSSASAAAAVPKLKHSLSLALTHFFPLAGKLALSAEPRLEYNDTDSVLLIVAAAPDGGAFKNLAGNHRRSCGDFRRLVPEMGGGDGPVLAVQITVFPEMGISIGFALRNAAADWRTFNNFLKEWAWICKNGAGGRHVASHDRSVILDTSGLRSFFLTEFWKLKNEIKESNYYKSSNNDIVRATFVLGPKEMGEIKKWILTRSDLLFGSTQLLLSPYVVACAFIWVCWMKAHWCTDASVVHYFGFIAGGLTRLPFAVPSNYAGNCVGFGRSAARRGELVGEDGVVHAAKAIGDTVKKLNVDMLSGARNWISEWEELRESELHITVSGSPKLDLYDLDFGWGRPVKLEEVSIHNHNAISLSESREVIGGIEIGVALPPLKMDAFTTLFNKV
ncbi:phenolic glucoside malonyltransferase 1-like [Salvia hispanica]|uniref:phenolic glucoside malonyltransferase 1-like n=1 Tax=Salvia hispanica TaxID=49212 RepID=UPI0020090F08|nr:phenolic glucoside malonyltransferase 1-like [Salvia hispanica]